MRRSSRLCVVTVVTVLAALVNGSVSSGIEAPPGCQQVTTRPVIEHGRSPGGQIWRLVTCHGQNLTVLHLWLPTKAGDSGASFTAVRPNRQLPIDDHAGTDAAEEQLYWGVTTADVVKVKLILATGRPLFVRTVFAPGALRSRYPYLRGLRFAAAVYSGLHRGTARDACPITAAGRQLRCRLVAG